MLLGVQLISVWDTPGNPDGNAAVVNVCCHDIQRDCLGAHAESGQARSLHMVSSVSALMIFVLSSLSSNESWHAEYRQWTTMP